MKTRIVLSCVAVAALLTGTAPAGASTSQHDLGKLRTATKEFHNVANSRTARYLASCHSSYTSGGHAPGSANCAGAYFFGITPRILREVSDGSGRV